MHNVEVDQSGRVEETTKPTALAFANGIHFSLKITARAKRRVLDHLSAIKPHLSRTRLHVLIFATLLYLLLRDAIERLDLVIVDPEYPGYEAEIKTRVLTLLRKDGRRVYKDQLTFKQIGKKSPAHKLAYRVFKGIVLPDKTISAEDVLAEF